MVELAAAIVISAVALTFFSDAMSRGVKMVRRSRRSGRIQVAHPDQSAA